MTTDITRRQFLGATGALGLTATHSASARRPASAGQWRSALYPEDWEPGYTDAQGRFLHDFSYAGYRCGEDLPTPPPGRGVDVTRPPYDADPTGNTDSTAAIQRALDDVGNAGGGTVYLPDGTYRIRPAGAANYALHIRHHHTVLCGAGASSTFLFNDEPMMRDRAVILLSPNPPGPDGTVPTIDWHTERDESIAITADLSLPTRTIPVATTTGLAVGDKIVIRLTSTTDWIAEQHMSDLWTPATRLDQVYYRIIEAIDPVAQTITVDIPTRYYLKTRDHPRIYRIADPVTEIGIADLAIGMRENTTPGTGSTDYKTPGTGAYQMHHARAVYANHVLNGWIRDVKSYQPQQNTSSIHLLSLGIVMDYSRSITIARADLRHAQYQGGGGNGDLYSFHSSDCLVRDARATDGRHNFVITHIQATGNVICDSTTVGTNTYASEMHAWLSVANLWDNVTVDDDQLRAVYRGTLGSNHGQTTTHTVFWNTVGRRCRTDLGLPSGYVVWSDQLGWGYIIGTRGVCTSVYTGPSHDSGARTDPDDFTEGIGIGTRLVPRSLYEDQLVRRRGRHS